MSNRLQFIRAMGRHWLFKLAAGVWTILTTLSTLVTFAPPQWQQRVSFIAYLPQWHWYIWALGFLAFILFFGFEATFKLYEEASRPQSSNSELAVGAAAAPGLSSGAAKALPSASITQQVSDAKHFRPNLMMLSAGFNWVTCGMRNVWTTISEGAEVGPDGGFGLMAMIRNAPAPVGEITATAENAAVSLDFFGGKNCRVGSIARAYWFGRSKNEIQIASGEQFAVLVGVFRGETIEIFNNPRQGGVQIPHRAGPLRNWSAPGLSRATVPFNEVVDVLVTVVNTDTGDTYLRKTVRFSNSASRRKLQAVVLD